MYRANFSKNLVRVDGSWRIILCLISSAVFAGSGMLRLLEREEGQKVLNYVYLVSLLSVE